MSMYGKLWPDILQSISEYISRTTKTEPITGISMELVRRRLLHTVVLCTYQTGSSFHYVLIGVFP